VKLSLCKFYIGFCTDGSIPLTVQIGICPFAYTRHMAVAYIKSIWPFAYIKSIWPFAYIGGIWPFASSGAYGHLPTSGSYIRLPIAKLGSNYRSGSFSPFMQMSLTLYPSTWAWPQGCPLPCQSHSPKMYVSQHRSLTNVGQKKASPHYCLLLETHVIGAERRAQVRPICSIFNQ
jgi:hypothetical protein